MTVVAPTPQPTASRPGRGMVIAGIVLIVLSVAGGIIGSAVTLGQFDIGSFERDVVISGPPTALIPGEIDFTVEEPLDPDATAAMTVGIGTDDATRNPSCTLTTADGEDVSLLGNAFDTTLLNDPDGFYSVVATARLDPGDYVAACRYPGEPSAGGGGNFTVGRTFGTEDMDDVLGPVLGFGAVVVVAGLLFVVGLVLLIVGLVRGGRARKNPPPGTGWAPGQPLPGQVPPGQAPPGQWPGYPPYGGPQQYPGQPAPPVPPPAGPPVAPPPAGPPPSWTPPPAAPPSWTPPPQAAPPSWTPSPSDPPPAAPPPDRGPDTGWPGPPG